MLVSQTARDCWQVCWLIEQVGKVGRYVFSQTAGAGRQVCWSVKQLG